MVREQAGVHKYHKQTPREMQRVAVHEIGHALGIGWADDTRPPWIGHVTAEKGYEVYSGNTDPNRAGGVDPTPEEILIDGDGVAEWSLMMWGTAPDTRDIVPETEEIDPPQPILAFSIEELSTVSFESIPSRDD